MSLIAVHLAKPIENCLVFDPFGHGVETERVGGLDGSGYDQLDTSKNL